MISIKKTILITLTILLALLLIIYIIYRLPLNNNIPDEMQQKVDELNSISKTKLELAENVYDFINNSYNSTIRGYLKEPNKFFHKDTTKIWNNRGEYYPSNAQNEMFRKMLLLSGEFDKKDFKFKQSWCTLVAHEYWILNIDNEKHFIDLWSADHNGEFSCYAIPTCKLGQIKCN